MPADQVAGDRYDPAQMAALDSENRPSRAAGSAAHAADRVDEHPDKVIEPGIRVAEDLGPGLQYQRGLPVTYPLGPPFQRVPPVTGTGRLRDRLLLNAESGHEAVDQRVAAWSSCRTERVRRRSPAGADPRMPGNGSTVSSC